jgi:hypothetical protein
MLMEEHNLDFWISGGVTGAAGGFVSSSSKFAVENEYLDIREVNSCEEAGGVVDSSTLRFIPGEREAICS